MTFDQIEKGGRTYINKFGIIFTPMLSNDKWMVSYDDGEGILNVEFMEPIKELKALLKNPDKVDVLVLYKFNNSPVIL